MKLSQWAKKQGIHYQTALKWFRAGKIENARQLDTGTILVDDEQKNDSVDKKLDKIKDMLDELLKR